MKGFIENVGIDCLTATVTKKRISIMDRCKDSIPPKRLARLSKGVGISHLSYADPAVCTSDFCIEAAERLFANEVQKEEIGAVIFVTQSSDYLIPATSYVIQHRLGLATDILAFDINLGCSGFTYGIYIAASLLQNIEKKVLLLVGDVSNKHRPAKSLTFLPVIGDAGAAAIVSRRVPEQSRKMFFDIASYGDKYQCIITPRGAARAEITRDEHGEILPEPENYTIMDGMEVTNFSEYETMDSIRSLLSIADISADALDIAVCHQANQMIVSTLAKKLGLPNEKVPFASEEIGNTSSASIPVCISELARRGEWKPYRHALLCGFGVGMSVASLLMDMSDTHVLPISEV